MRKKTQCEVNADLVPPEKSIDILLVFFPVSLPVQPVVVDHGVSGGLRRIVVF